MKSRKKDPIHEINMKNLEGEEMVSYIDGEIVIADDIRKLPCYSNDTVKLRMIVIILCTKGRLQMDTGSHTYVIYPNDFLFCPPNILLSNSLITPNFEGKIIGISERIFQRLLHNGNDIWNKAFYVSKNPIIHMKEDQLFLFVHYYELIKQKITAAPNLYHKEIIQSLIQAILYEICADLDKSVVTLEDDGMRQGDVLFRKFVKLLEESNGRERLVSYYARELCVTPKYLSFVCKDISQKPALAWIHDYLTENIRYQLKHSDKSIKEIVEDLNFPSLSFFGKYVKTHFGMSPRRVRGIS
ncbi:MAG: helix-turn-helix domain-containing protein [Bacteroidaceae bacterium]